LTFGVSEDFVGVLDKSVLGYMYDDFCYTGVNSLSNSEIWKALWMRWDGILLASKELGL
jgi:hypothetical protein